RFYSGGRYRSGAHRLRDSELACWRASRSGFARVSTTRTDAELTRTVTLGDPGVAQAVFGPLHRHVANIQEAFRDPNAPRGAPAYRVTLDAQGDRLIARARAGGEADLERVQRIVDALVDPARSKGRVREGDVLAAISFSEGNTDQTGPMRLPQLGGLTLRT